KWRMIAMGMADEDVAHGPSVDRIDQRRQMRLVLRAGVDYRQIVAAEDIAVGAMEGEWAWIVGRQSQHTGSCFDRLAASRFKTGVEFQCHAVPSRWRQSKRLPLSMEAHIREPMVLSRHGS